MISHHINQSIWLLAIGVCLTVYPPAMAQNPNKGLHKPQIQIQNASFDPIQSGLLEFCYGNSSRNFYPITTASNKFTLPSYYREPTIANKIIPQRVLDGPSLHHHDHEHVRHA